MRRHDDTLVERELLAFGAQDEKFVGMHSLARALVRSVEDFQRPEQIERRDAVIADESDPLHAHVKIHSKALPSPEPGGVSRTNHWCPKSSDERHGDIARRHDLFVVVKRTDREALVGRRLIMRRLSGKSRKVFAHLTRL